MADVDLIELASQERNLREDIRATGADPDRDHEDGRPKDGDLTAPQVVERSLGPEWDRAFAFAKAKGNSNKASCVFADARYADPQFAEEVSDAT